MVVKTIPQVSSLLSRRQSEDDLTLPAGLATYGLQKLYHVFPIEESLSSVNTISSLLIDPSITSVRTGLLMTSIIYEVLGPEMQAMTSQVLSFLSLPPPSSHLARSFLSFSISQQIRHQGGSLFSSFLPSWSPGSGSVPSIASRVSLPLPSPLLLLLGTKKQTPILRISSRSLALLICQLQ
jgi:hypothetical protein